MARFLTTDSTIGKLDDLLIEAEKFLLLVSAFWKPKKQILDRLRDAAGRGVTITIIYGKKELDHDVMEAFKRIQGIKVYFLEELHAKCYLNEKECILTSMNLYEASQKNREMGVLFDRHSDADLYTNAWNEVKSILESATQDHATGQIGGKEPGELTSSGNGKGFCIRCKTVIRLDPDRPLCWEDYDTWAQFGDENYRENYCHGCGEEGSVSKGRPLCRSCYQQTDWSPARRGWFW